MPTPVDNEAFAAFQTHTYPAVYLNLALFTGDPERAETLARKAFQLTLARWRHLRLEDPVAYVHLAAWRLATRRRPWLRRGRRTSAAGEPDDFAATLAALAPPHRQAVILADVAHLPAADIAHLTGAAAAAVDAWLAPARPDPDAAVQSLRAATPPPTPFGTLRRGVRHRRVIVTGIAAAIVGLLAATGVSALPRATAPTLAADEPVATSAAVDTASPEPSPTDADPTPPAPQPSPTPTRIPAGRGPDYVAPTSTTNTPQNCSGSFAERDEGGGWFTLTYDYTRVHCDYVTIRIYWASYRLNPDGSATLYASHVYHLNRDDPTVRFHIDMPPTCHAWYIVHGENPISATLSASTVNNGSIDGADTREHDDLATCPTSVPTADPTSTANPAP